MINLKNKLAGIIIFIFSAVIIYLSGINVLFFPSQEDQLRGELEYGALVRGIMIVQEITAKKNYIDAVELILSALGPQYHDSNTIMLLDSDFRVLYEQNFNSGTLLNPQYKLFKFPHKIFIGKGKKVILCLLSSTGDKESHLSVPRNPGGKLGALSIRPVVGDDIQSAINAAKQVFLLEGSLCVRAYESNYRFINWFKVMLLFLAALIALCITFLQRIKLFINRLNFKSEKIYAVLAIVFGLLLVFITPPLQVPDEDQHLYRTYQIAEFNIFQHDKTVPSSLVRLTQSFNKLFNFSPLTNFGALEKTSVDEIISQKSKKLNPQKRTKPPYVPGYIFPYMPQAAGMFIGKLMNLSPVLLLYVGRVFNLLFSVLLIYFAIKITPFFKWIFFLLGLMPMTMHLCASLSKDGMIISFAFVLIALFLRFAYGAQKVISTKDIIILFIMTFLVSTTRPIYAILIGMFFLIPIYKIGTLKRYVLIFSCLIITAFMATQAGFVKQLYQYNIADKDNHSVSHRALSSQEMLSPVPADGFAFSEQPIFRKGVNFNEQKSFILNNPIKYARILFNTIFLHSRDLHLDSFVGIMGWMNKPLPNWLIYMYLLILLITAFLLYGKSIRIKLVNKIIITAIFIAGVVLIETGIYLTWTPVGKGYIEGVQGRYFIPYAPLFFLLLYNTVIGNKVNNYFKASQNIAGKIKNKFTGKNGKLTIDNQQIPLGKLFYLLIISICTISLLGTVYFLIKNYYVVLV